MFAVKKSYVACFHTNSIQTSFDPTFWILTTTQKQVEFAHFKT